MVAIPPTIRLQWRYIPAATLSSSHPGGSVVATFVFDTHRAVKDLAAAGFPGAQVEALVEIVGAAVGENAATKSDLDAQEQRLNARIDAAEQRTNARIDSMEQRLTIRFIAVLLPSLGLLFAAMRFLS